MAAPFLSVLYTVRWDIPVLRRNALKCPIITSYSQHLGAVSNALGAWATLTTLSTLEISTWFVKILISAFLQLPAPKSGGKGQNTQPEHLLMQWLGFARSVLRTVFSYRTGPLKVVYLQYGKHRNLPSWSILLPFCLFDTFMVNKVKPVLRCRAL